VRKGGKLMKLIFFGSVATVIFAAMPLTAHAVTALHPPTVSPAATVPSIAPATVSPKEEAAKSHERVAAGRVEELALGEGRIKVNGITFRFTPNTVPIIDKTGSSSAPRLQLGDRVLLTLSGSTSEPHVEKIWFLGK
jgi:hypothetical protein